MLIKLLIFIPVILIVGSIIAYVGKMIKRDAISEDIENKNEEMEYAIKASKKVDNDLKKDYKKANKKIKNY